ncbi:MAG: magnesium transporter [Alphaproteobacteria bacterium]|nr:magnesium transporter [Alphaproteobacteria bacterium]
MKTLKDDFRKTHVALTERRLDKLLAEWGSMPGEEHGQIFRALDRRTAEELFLRILPYDQAELFMLLPPLGRKSWIRILPPDDAADLIQELEEEERPAALDLLDTPTRMEVQGLLAYHEDEAGGLMSPRFARLRPDATVEEALRYLRAQTRQQVETIYYAYVLDQNQKLLGTVSLRDLFSADPFALVRDIMTTGDDMAFIREDQDQEEIARIFGHREYRVMPVVDDEFHMKGIVTVDDIVQIVEEEATEDIQKMGGMEAFDEPYFKISILDMVKKRAGWLLALFIGEMFTATAMGHYQNEIAKAVVLALFVPLIMSSGGNSGSQATTLVIRAMALGEIRLRDWWRVFLRECLSGLLLGLILGVVGIIRIYLWPGHATLYGPHYPLIALAVGGTLVGIVLWGSLMGSMLPMLLRRVGVDPAIASAPFVATLVDVTGLVIYFSVASMLLKGTLL